MDSYKATEVHCLGGFFLGLQSCQVVLPFCQVCLENWLNLSNFVVDGTHFVRGDFAAYNLQAVVFEL